MCIRVCVGVGRRWRICSARAEKYEKHVVMLDTDIVVIGDLLHLFNEEFDYGLSARGNLQVTAETTDGLLRRRHPRRPLTLTLG